MAITQMRQPHDVEQPSPRKSKIQPTIFSPQPRRLKAKSPIMMIAMIPRISIYSIFVSFTQMLVRIVLRFLIDIGFRIQS